MSAAEMAQERLLPSRPSVRRVMSLVLLALLPGALAQVWLSGSHFAWQLLVAIAFGIGLEAMMLKLRARPLRPFLGDFSAVLAALLFALLLPPSTPWWMIALGLFAAVVVAKHLFGGLGENLFNPAMVGVAVLLLGFPMHFAGESASQSGIPTWIGGLYALGGVFLLWKKIIPWHTPFALLTGAALTEILLRIVGVQSGEYTLAELLPGTMLLAAFFIVTDPVTGCLSSRGRLYFGAGVGLLTVLLSHLNSVPLALPFAVLTMNCAAPWLDRHTRPVGKISVVQS